MHLYSAMSLIHTERADMDHTVLPANYTMPLLLAQVSSAGCRTGI